MIPVHQFTSVVNIRSSKYDVYCGRAGHGQDGYFGNPHVVGFCNLCHDTHEQGEAVIAFERYFYERLWNDRPFLHKVLDLRGQRLGCFCKPKRCHCDVIVEFLDWYFSQPEFIRAQVGKSG